MPQICSPILRLSLGGCARPSAQGKLNLRIAVASVFDPRDERSWSGCSSYLLRALEAQGASIDVLGPLDTPERLTDKIKRKVYPRLGRNYLSTIMPAMLASFARQTEERLAQSHADCVLSLDAMPIASANIDRPLFYFWDCTFEGNLEYPWFAALSPECIRSGHAMERAALSKVRSAFFSSNWALNSAQRTYGVNPDKLRLVPLAANLDPMFSHSEAERLVDARATEKVELLFLGVDWLRKGGDLALEVASLLNFRGLPARLTVAGVDPPQPIPSFVDAHGFLNKSDAAQHDRLRQLITRSHFLIVPSLAESFGCVFAEANAFAVPSVSRRVGGIDSVLHAGVNGQLFAPADPASKYADYIECVIRTPGRYRELALAAFADFNARLTWGHSAAKLLAFIEEGLGRQTTSN
jgi:glycosyltransferase involved in cell wall biosynthesis